MNGSPVAALVRGWVDLYTRGLPAEARAARRDEIDDDLWCEYAEAAALGSLRSLHADIAMRLIFGVPADVSWRIAYRRTAPAAIMERSSSMSTRTLGVLSIVGALTLGILLILFIPLSHGVWTGSIGVSGVIGTLVALLALSAAALGLVWRYPDHIGLVGALGAMVVAIGAVGSMSEGRFLVALVVGTAMLTSALARISVISWIIPVVQVVSVIPIVVFILSAPSVDDAGARAFMFVVLAPYLLTWIATGVSLVRRVPRAQAPSG